MIYLSQNLRALRKDQRISQQVLADKLLVSRASLAKYEGAVNEPSLDVLLRISRYFRVTVDTLLSVDLTKHNLSSFIQGKYDGGMIMPIQVDRNGENVIEVVAHSAQAGYTGNYSDPGFIESLDQMALPFQELHGKCRAFPIQGDSMPPHEEGCYVIGRFIESRAEVTDGKRYVLVSRDEGIVFKRVYRDQEEEGCLLLHSDNPKYKPFRMPFLEIVELWEFVAAISFEHSSHNYFANEVLVKVRELQDEVQKLALGLSPSI